jgi:hypothetical protein
MFHSFALCYNFGIIHRNTSVTDISARGVTGLCTEISGDIFKVKSQKSFWLRLNNIVYTKNTTNTEK